MNLPPPFPSLTELEVAALESEVLPRYLSFFFEAAMSMVASGGEQERTPSIVVMGAHGGIETELIADRFPHARLVGLEASEASVKVAMGRLASLSLASSYELMSLPTSLAKSQFTHALSVHPICPQAVREQLFRDIARVLIPGGQAVVGLALRGSFPEIADLLREYALRSDLPRFSESVDIATQNRPTPETLGEELERSGLGDVYVDVQLLSVPFESGKAFAQSPVFDLIIEHDVRASIDAAKAVVDDALAYLKHAISRYWSDGTFELTVNVGCASGRRRE